MVVEEVLHLKRHEWRLAGDKEIDERTCHLLNDILGRLLAGEPIQYILGHAWFLNERYLVNSGTLIPRPETEELVQWLIESIDRNKNYRILDVGTGTGCIAISIQKALPDAQVYAIDLSRAAIQTARMNAQNILGPEAAHRMIQADMTDARWWDEQNAWEIIVSNPPYVMESEKKEMEEHVFAFEPSSALFVSNNEPLFFYSTLAEKAQKHLTPEGQLYFEINAALGQATKDMLYEYGFESELRKDLFGKDRMIRARKANRT